MKILDLGCGNKKTDGSTGIDINPELGADIVHDLNVYPYPLGDNEYDMVICNDILEHLDDVVRTMDEIYRVSRNGCIVKIRVPYASGKYVFADPTHKRGFTKGSFDYFCEGTDAYRKGYTKSKFEKLSVEFEKVCFRNHWGDRFLVRMANRHKDYYETRFMYIFPIETVYFELKAVK